MTELDNILHFITQHFSEQSPSISIEHVLVLLISKFSPLHTPSQSEQFCSFTQQVCLSQLLLTHSLSSAKTLLGQPPVHPLSG